MYIIYSSYRNTYAKTSRSDTTKRDEAKVFKTKKAADKFKETYLARDYDVLKIKE